MKYPRTYHVPWSPGATSDDKKHSNMRFLENQEIVVTLKLDGENTSMDRNKVWARSLDSSDHVSRHFVKSLHAQIKYLIPENMIIHGENVYAVHSIVYTGLPSYFLVFGVSVNKVFLSWDETVDVCNNLGLHLVPVLYRGSYIVPEYTEYSHYGLMEGYVMRPASSFSDSKMLAKYVRPNHVQTDQHWAYQKIKVNKLAVYSDNI